MRRYSDLQLAQLQAFSQTFYGTEIPANGVGASAAVLTGTAAGASAAGDSDDAVKEASS